MTGSAGRQDAEEVYGPAEDSALLAAVLIDAVSPGDRVLDVGTGSGYVASKIAETGVCVVGSDINPHACRHARARGIETVCADLTAPFRDGAFDVVAFNPPYLPEIDDTPGGWFETAVSGGPTGRAVVERFLDGLGRVLAPGGAAFLLVSTHTGIDVVVGYAGTLGFSPAVVDEDTYPGETLVVLRLMYNYRE